MITKERVERMRELAQRCIDRGRGTAVFIDDDMCRDLLTILRAHDGGNVGQNTKDNKPGPAMLAEGSTPSPGSISPDDERALAAIQALISADSDEIHDGVLVNGAADGFAHLRRRLSATPAKARVSKEWVIQSVRGWMDCDKPTSIAMLVMDILREAGVEVTDD